MAIMTNWFTTYHHVLLLRLLGLAVLFGVLLPGCAVLVATTIRCFRAFSGLRHDATRKGEAMRERVTGTARIRQFR